MQFVTSTPAPTSVTNGQYSWTIGSLSPWQTGQIVLFGRIP
jgi:hypothetical protein